MAEKVDNGHCLCGDVKFRLTGEPLFNTICHCENCRRQGGSTLHCASIFTKPQWTLLTPNAPITVYADHATQSGTPLDRHFCTRCGSCVFAVTAFAEHIISVPAGVLERAGADWVPHKEQFVRDKVVTSWMPDFEHVCEEVAMMQAEEKMARVKLDRLHTGPGSENVDKLS